MNAWNRNPKKNTTPMEQNRNREAINNQNNFASRSANNTANQSQRGNPTRLRYRRLDLDIQWID